MNRMMKEALYKKALLGNDFGRSIQDLMAANPDAMQISDLSTKLKGINADKSKLTKLTGLSGKQGLAIAGLIGLIAGAVMMGRKKETKYTFGGNSNDI